MRWFVLGVLAGVAGSAAAVYVAAVLSMSTSENPRQWWDDSQRR